MKKEFSRDSREKKLQMLSLAHIDTQKEMEKWLYEGRFASPYETDFILEIHRDLYSRPGMEAFLHIRHEGMSADMIPGRFREMPVEIGGHIPPDASKVPGLMAEFAHLYAKARSATLSMRLIHALFLTATGAYHGWHSMGRSSLTAFAAMVFGTYRGDSRVTWPSTKKCSPTPICRGRE